MGQKSACLDEFIFSITRTHPQPDMNCPSTLRQNQNQNRSRQDVGAPNQEVGAGRSARITQPALKAGTHVARCCGWVDLGTQVVPEYGRKEAQEDAQNGIQMGTGSRNQSLSRLQVGAPSKEPKMQRRVMITWLIRGEAGESWRVSREFAYGFGPRCGLRKLLEGWRGKVFANEAAARAVDPLRVLEQPGLVVVGFKEGSTWPRVEAVLPMLKGVAVESLRWPPVFFTLEKPDRETFLRLPPWVRRKIRGSAEWGALGGK